MTFNKISVWKSIYMIQVKSFRSNIILISLRHSRKTFLFEKKTKWKMKFHVFELQKRAKRNIDLLNGFSFALLVVMWACCIACVRARSKLALTTHTFASFIFWSIVSGTFSSTLTHLLSLHIFGLWWTCGARQFDLCPHTRAHTRTHDHSEQLRIWH